MLSSGILHEQIRRYFVCLSLAEAETIRRIIHINDSSHEALIQDGDMEIALRFNPTNGNTTSNSPLCGDGGLILDASKNWRSENDINTGASLFQRALSQNSFQFFNCDMHYSEPAVFMLIKSLQHTSLDEREQFFLSTVGSSPYG